MEETREKSEPLTEEEIQWVREYKKWVEEAPKRRQEFFQAMRHGMGLSSQETQKYLEELEQERAQTKGS